MEAYLWWLLCTALPCAIAIAILLWSLRARAERQREHHLEQAEEANQLCRQYCELILRLKADPFNPSLCQKFLVCASAYHRGDSHGEITTDVERMIMHDLKLAGVRRVGMFGRLAH